MDTAVVIHKVWRSEIERVLILLGLCVAAVVLSHYFPSSIIEGELISFGDTRAMLKLPLFALMPVVAFGDLIARLYDVCYIIDQRGIEAQKGIISLRRSIMRLRFEDVRLVEFDQSLLERFLDIGDIQVGTAASSEVELIMEGVAAPREIQEMLQSERDRRHIVTSAPDTNLERANA